MTCWHNRGRPMFVLAPSRRATATTVSRPQRPWKQAALTVVLTAFKDGEVADYADALLIPLHGNLGTFVNTEGRAGLQRRRQAARRSTSGWKSAACARQRARLPRFRFCFQRSGSRPGGCRHGIRSGLDNGIKDVALGVGGTGGRPAAHCRCADPLRRPAGPSRPALQLTRDGAAPIRENEFQLGLCRRCQCPRKQGEGKRCSPGRTRACPPVASALPRLMQRLPRWVICSGAITVERA